MARQAQELREMARGLAKRIAQLQREAEAALKGAEQHRDEQKRKRR